MYTSAMTSLFLEQAMQDRLKFFSMALLPLFSLAILHEILIRSRAIEGIAERATNKSFRIC